MFGRIGLPELILILVIALIIFGPRKLPEIGRSIGRGIREFRQATTEISKSVSLDDEGEEVKKAKSPKEEDNPENPVIDMATANTGEGELAATSNDESAKEKAY